ncbi:MAG: CrcB family protein [Planctomycetes bacterium]|nr:CrcB family protein [Planctomycetota bacterium]
MVIKIALIAIAGALGTLGRFGLSEAAKAIVGAPNPWGTVAANMLGCFLFGTIFALGEARTWLSPETRMIILAGFMGAFTTFSTWMFESTAFIQHKQYLLAAGNVMGQTAIGFAFMWLGLKAGQYLA